jgi:hypothetical protein
MTNQVEGAHETLYAGSTNNLALLIEKCAFPQEAFFLAECFPRQVITDLQERQDLLRFAYLSDGIEPSRYTSGRIFCPDRELRWHQNQATGTVQAVYLGVDCVLPELTRRSDLAPLKKNARSKQYYLFGEVLQVERLRQMGLAENQGYYAEVRIPRLLRYPDLDKKSSKRRLQLSVCEYIEEKTGEVTLFRFQNLAEAE